MRRPFQVTLAVIALASSGFAQGFESMSYTSTAPVSTSSSSKKLNLFLSAGAGFSLGGRFEGSSDQIEMRSAGTVTVETDDEYLNLGRGLKIDLGATYRFLEHVDVLAGFNMTFGVPYTEVEQSIKNLNVTPNTEATQTWTWHHAQFGFKLLLVPRFKAFDLVDIYVGAGLGLYWTSLSFDHSERTITQQLYEEEVKVDTKASLPFIGMLGVEYPVSKAVILYLDATYEAMNITPQEMTVEKTNFPVGGNGTDAIKYEEGATDRDAPIKIPGSNLAIRLGIKIPLF